MEAVAKVRHIRMSPQKARIVADMVRGRKASDALGILHFTPKKPARIIEKILRSALANAEEKNVTDPEDMTIETIFVDRGPVIKRMLPRARGRADVLRKPLSHITLVLTEEKPADKTKPGQTTEAGAKKAAGKGTK